MKRKTFLPAGLFTVLLLTCPILVVAQDEIVIKKTFKSFDLSGNVKNVNGDSIGNATVEKLTKNWHKTLASTLTNSNGFFSFQPNMGDRPKKIYHLRIRKEGFDTLLIRVEVSKGAKQNLMITLTLSN